MSACFVSARLAFDLIASSIATRVLRGLKPNVSTSDIQVGRLSRARVVTNLLAEGSTSRTDQYAFHEPPGLLHSRCSSPHR